MLFTWPTYFLHKFSPSSVSSQTGGSRPTMGTRSRTFLKARALHWWQQWHHTNHGSAATKGFHTYLGPVSASLGGGREPTDVSVGLLKLQNVYKIAIVIHFQFCDHKPEMGRNHYFVDILKLGTSSYTPGNQGFPISISPLHPWQWHNPGYHITPFSSSPHTYMVPNFPVEVWEPLF